MNYKSNDTICAIATATGGAIGIVRISGARAIDIASSIFQPHAGAPLAERSANVVVYGNIVSASGEVLDDVLATLFRAPHSYTGEDAVEFSCHGSPYVLQQVMQLLVAGGCRQAEAGEYTKRAFLNGKMDLSQAEAVADLIASSSAATHRMAMSQMRGDFSRSLSALREKLLRLTSLMELELDFSDHEELEFADRSELRDLSAEIATVIGRLASSFSLGNALKRGVPVAIVGETNAGKSTLLNALVGEERAIVSNIHGTTRDTIEDTVNIDGILFRFIDTAGIRDTADQIESLGIARTFKKLEEAQIVLWVIDSTCASLQAETLAPRLLPLCKEKDVVVVFNKCDLCAEASLTASPDSLTASPDSRTASADWPSTLTADLKSLQTLSLSAKQQTNIQSLRRVLTSCVQLPDSADGIIVSNVRHYEALTRALAAIGRVQDGLATSLPTDLVAQDLRDCLSALADITGGEITTQETLSNIFQNFCVGK